MNRFLIVLLGILLTPQARAQLPVPPPATAAQAIAGVLTFPYINPTNLAAVAAANGWGTGGGGGVTAGQATNIAVSVTANNAVSLSTAPTTFYLASSYSEFPHIAATNACGIHINFSVNGSNGWASVSDGPLFHDPNFKFNKDPCIFLYSNSFYIISTVVNSTNGNGSYPGTNGFSVFTSQDCMKWSLVGYLNPNQAKQWHYRPQVFIDQTNQLHLTDGEATTWLSGFLQPYICDLTLTTNSVSFANLRAMVLSDTTSGSSVSVVFTNGFYYAAYTGSSQERIDASASYEAGYGNIAAPTSGRESFSLVNINGLWYDWIYFNQYVTSPDLTNWSGLQVVQAMDYDYANFSVISLTNASILNKISAGANAKPTRQMRQIDLLEDNNTTFGSLYPNSSNTFTLFVGRGHYPGDPSYNLLEQAWIQWCFGADITTNFWGISSDGNHINQFRVANNGSTYVQGNLAVTGGTVFGNGLGLSNLFNVILTNATPAGGMSPVGTITNVPLYADGRNPILTIPVTGLWKIFGGEGIMRSNLTTSGTSTNFLGYFRTNTLTFLATPVMSTVGSISASSGDLTQTPLTPVIVQLNAGDVIQISTAYQPAPTLGIWFVHDSWIEADLLK